MNITQKFLEEAKLNLEQNAGLDTNREVLKEASGHYYIAARKIAPGFSNGDFVDPDAYYKLTSGDYKTVSSNLQKELSKSNNNDAKEETKYIIFKYPEDYEQSAYCVVLEQTSVIEKDSPYPRKKTSKPLWLLLGVDSMGTGYLEIAASFKTKNDAVAAAKKGVITSKANRDFATFLVIEDSGDYITLADKEKVAIKDSPFE